MVHVTFKHTTSFCRAFDLVVGPTTELEVNFEVQQRFLGRLYNFITITLL